MGVQLCQDFTEAVTISLEPCQAASSEASQQGLHPDTCPILCWSDQSDSAADL